MEAWFEPEMSKYCVVVTLSALAAFAHKPIHQGTHKRLIYGVWFTLMTVGAGLLVLWVVAQQVQQPQHVSQPLLAAGVALLGAFAGSFFGVVDGYRKAESRRVVAFDL